MSKQQKKKVATCRQKYLSTYLIYSLTILRKSSRRTRI